MRQHQRRRRSVEGLDTREGHALQIAAVVACGLESVERELPRDVVRRKVPAARAGAATLEQVIREKLDVRANPLGVDAADGRGDLGREREPLCRGVGRRGVRGVVGCRCRRPAKNDQARKNDRCRAP